MPWKEDGSRKKSIFYLRSGNSPLFKEMGSSPVKDTGPHTGLNPPHTEDNHVAGEGWWSKEEKMQTLLEKQYEIEDVLPTPPEKETIKEKKTIKAEGVKEKE